MHKERPENKSRVRLGQFLPNMVFRILIDKSDKNNPVTVSDITNIIYDMGIISEDGEDKNRTVRRCLQDLVGLSKALYDPTDTGIYARITLGNWNGRIVEISNNKNNRFLYYFEPFSDEERKKLLSMPLMGGL